MSATTRHQLGTGSVAALLLCAFVVAAFYLPPRVIYLSASWVVPRGAIVPQAQVLYGAGGFLRPADPETYKQTVMANGALWEWHVLMRYTEGQKARVRVATLPDGKIRVTCSIYYMFHRVSHHSQLIWVGCQFPRDP